MRPITPSSGTNRRVAMRIFIATAVAASISLPAFAQTQRTQPSASATAPTESSTSATSATTANDFVDPFYSAVTPTETTNPRAPALGDQDRAKLRIEAKGYSNISGLAKGQPRNLARRSDNERWQIRRRYPRFRGQYLLWARTVPTA